ncbi:DUF3226 domain-containing protein [Desulfofundulus thermosubterraneus]|uniref:RloB-like protein n=1 Tax=Desulfofundulus thermosubterraneus DSM 16057 TaxID=1121432 RepID=A0A1M6E943_9FIRM|nr:DUF3226 domain-containing protein [Desulfofundulus thermosubterraneus]SHI81870.1 hypothetical protein SAMN02745219_01148 [Desulfofundulus thermosubterraneus DSM 16057]
MSVRIEKSHVLVVEGKDEQLFFNALINSYKTELNLPDIQILPIGGKSRLPGNLKALVNSPGFTEVISLGIVRDADEDAWAAFQSICSALGSAGLPVPPAPLVSAGSNPSVTVVVLPGDNRPGMLEDVCLAAVQDEPALLCVKQYFECLQNMSLSLPRQISKAMLQVFLASRPEVGKRLGEAALAGYFSLSSDAFGQLREFLKRMSV